MSFKGPVQYFTLKALF